MNIEEVEEPKKYENLETKPVLDPFKNTEKYENYQEKWTSKKLTSRKVRKFTDKTPAGAGRGHPKTTKIHRRNEHASTKPRK